MQKDDALNQYLVYLETANISKGGIAKRKHHIEKLFSIAPKAEMKDFTSDDIQKYIQKVNEMRVIKYDEKKADWTEKPYAKSTVSQYLSSVFLFFDYLFKFEVIDSNPCEIFDLPKQPRVLNREGLHEEDVNKLISVIDVNTPIGQRDKTIIEFFYGTGMRISEVMKLDIYDVKFKNELIHIRQAKGKKDRIIPLSPYLKKQLNKYLKNIRPILINFNFNQQAFFLTVKGFRLSSSSIYHLLHVHTRAAKITKKVTPHVFRHTFAIHLLKNGAPLRYIQELLGHSSIQTTMVYTKIFPYDLKNKIEEYHPLERSELGDIELKKPVKMKHMMRWKSKKQEKKKAN